MKLYRIVDEGNYNDYKDKDRIFVESMTVVDIEPELEEAYEWNKNKLATITKNIY